MTDYDTLPAAPASRSGPGKSLAPSAASEGLNIVRFAERTVDGEQEFAIREILNRILVRKWVLAACIVVPTLVSLAITMLTPMTWTATTKILIRYGTSESAFMKDLMPDDRTSISAAAAGEIIRSLPTLEEVVRQQNIQDSDLYLPTSKVMSDYVSRFFHLIFRTEPSTPEEERLAAARRLQDSLQGSSMTKQVTGKADAIEVLSNPSPVPQSLKGDELITLTVKAFNREKVAGITNGLARSFIDQYEKISAADAHRAFVFLSQLAEKFEADIRRLQEDPGALAATAPGGAHALGGDGHISRDSPMMTSLANQLAALEANLQAARQIYKEGSPEIERQKAEIDNLRAVLSGQERIEVARQALEQIRERRFQAQNTERLYQSHLEPISVIEPAVTPPSSTSARVMRLLASGLIGLLIGTVVGLAVTILLGVLDQRLFTAWDVERSLAMPVFGWLPTFLGLRGKPGGLPMPSEAAILMADDGLSPVVGRLHAPGMRDRPGVVAIASASDDDGKSFVSLMLAKAIARDGESKILLIDADPARASLTERFRQDAACDPEGAMIDPSLQGLVMQTDDPGIDLVPQPPGPDQGVANYAQWLHECLHRARGHYDLIIVDTPSLVLTGRSLVCCRQADWILLVVRCGVSRKGPIRDFLRKLHEITAAPYGAVLNFQNRIWAGSAQGGS